MDVFRPIIVAPEATSTSVGRSTSFTSATYAKQDTRVTTRGRCFPAAVPITKFTPAPEIMKAPTATTPRRSQRVSRPVLPPTPTPPSKPVRTAKRCAQTPEPKRNHAAVSKRLKRGGKSCMPAIEKEPPRKAAKKDDDSHRQVSTRSSRLKRLVSSSPFPDSPDRASVSSGTFKTPAATTGRQSRRTSVFVVSPVPIPPPKLTPARKRRAQTPPPKQNNAAGSKLPKRGGKSCMPAIARETVRKSARKDADFKVPRGALKKTEKSSQQAVYPPHGRNLRSRTAAERSSMGAGNGEVESQPFTSKSGEDFGDLMASSAGGHVGRRTPLAPALWDLTTNTPADLYTIDWDESIQVEFELPHIMRHQAVKKLPITDVTSDPRYVEMMNEPMMKQALQQNPSLTAEAMFKALTDTELTKEIEKNVAPVFDSLLRTDWPGYAASKPAVQDDPEFFVLPPGPKAPVSYDVECMIFKEILAGHYKHTGHLLYCTFCCDFQHEEESTMQYHVARHLVESFATA